MGAKVSKLISDDIPLIFISAITFFIFHNKNIPIQNFKLNYQLIFKFKFLSIYPMINKFFRLTQNYKIQLIAADKA